jgi:hypothetical protein
MAGRSATFTKVWLCGGDIVPFRFVKFGANKDTVLQATAATDAIIGISNIPLSYNEPLKYGAPVPPIKLVAGKPIDIVLLGIFPIELGAVLTAGELVTSGVDGRAVAMGATPAVGTFVARMLEGGAVGAIKPVLLMQAITA